MHASQNQPHRPFWRDPLLWAAILFYTALILGLALIRYSGYNAGMLDLGNMFQAISSVLRGQPLVFTQPFGPYSRLAGHVELFYYAFVPLTLVWRDPQALLVGQTLLVAAGAIPAYRLALRRLERPFAAHCAALIYLLYPVGLTAALFDFHGDTLAMPLLMFALDALDRRAWRPFALWVALALSCKVYVALPVAGIGAYMFLWGGQRRAGMITAAAAVAYGLLIFFPFRELFAPPALERSVAGVYTSHYFGDLAEIPATIVPRLLNALIVFGPALFLAWRAWPWLLVGAPVALAALLSTGPGGVYDFRYHHYALVVPFLVMAVIDGATTLRARPSSPRPRNWRADLVVTTLIVTICSSVLIDTPLNPLFWMGLPGMGLDHSVYGVLPRDRVKDRFIAEHVPPAVPIAASMFLAPRLADRDTIYAVRYNDDPGGRRLPGLLPQIDYLLADALFDWRQVNESQLLGGVTYEAREIALLLRDPAFGLVAARDGLLLFRRDPPPGAALAQSISVVETAGLPVQEATFGPVTLVGVQVEPLGGRRYRAGFAWRLTGETPPTRRIVAVSRLEGVEGARIVHLPSYLLLPAHEWQPGQIIREEFDIELPSEVQPGGYIWLVGWYETGRSDAYATDERSRVPGSSEVAIITIEVRQ